MTRLLITESFSLLRYSHLQIANHDVDFCADLPGQLNPESRRKILCGLDFRADAPHISLDEDERVSGDAGVTFDVDSIIGFPSSLAVAKRGIRWSPTRMTVSDLQSDLHLRPISVTYCDTDGVLHQAHRPVHHVPHYTFGRAIGFEDISLYFLFPKLYRAEQKCSKIRDEEHDEEPHDGQIVAV